MYFQREKDGLDAYLMIKFNAPLNALSNLYERLIKVDVPPIETIPETEKLIHWNIAKKYHEEKRLAIKASKSAYIIDLITSNN